MITNLKHIIGNNIINIPGWRTKRKIIVFESDDWGSIRMPSRIARDKLLVKFPNLYSKETYDLVDNLANKDDLAFLFDVLYKYKDKNGNHPIFTANTIVANPDFSKIKASEYNQYYYELFTATLEKYPHHKGTFEVWKQGIDEGVFKPQYHGREHLNVALWLKSLKENRKGVHEAFENETWMARLDNGQRLDIAFNYYDETQLEFIVRSLVDGARIFEEIFGYKSTSFIAPSYTWCDNIEQCLKGIGIKYIQSGFVQSYPQKIINDYNKKNQRHYLGQNNEIGQLYFMRNCHFEPALMSGENILKLCENYIETIFRWNKPVIISTHRLNYIGNLEPSNQRNTLKLLDLLLSVILTKYPNVEFMSSDMLGDLMSSENFD